MIKTQKLSPASGSVKELIVHNQVQTLSRLYVMLGSSLMPTIVQNREGPADNFPCALPSAAKSAVEVTFIDVCNRISELVKNVDLWTIDKSDEKDYSDKMEEESAAIQEALIAQFMEEFSKEKQPRQNKKKEGNTEDEQQ